MKAVGSVVDMGYGRGFSAGVDLNEEGPFSFVLGPEFVSAEEAVGWARGQARRVTVRVGDTHYTAGEEPVRDLPPWEPDPGAAPVPARPAGEPRRWRIEVHLNWLRSDGAEVARGFADALRAEAEVEDVTHGMIESGFAVVFELVGASDVEVKEAASRVLRGAWKATGTEATPGTDYDGPSIVVSPA